MFYLKLNQSQITIFIHEMYISWVMSQPTNQSFGLCKHTPKYQWLKYRIVLYVVVNGKSGFQRRISLSSTTRYNMILPCFDRWLCICIVNQMETKNALWMLALAGTDTHLIGIGKSLNLHCFIVSIVIRDRLKLLKLMIVGTNLGIHHCFFFKYKSTMFFFSTFEHK